MMIRHAAPVAVMILLLGTPALGEAQRLETPHRVRTDTLPAAAFTIDSTLHPVGRQAISLGGGSRAEQFFWVASRGDSVRRFLWLQFEGKPVAAPPYDYRSDSLVVAHGIPWRVAFRYYPPSGLSDPAGSDGERARRRVEAAGYRFGAGLARIRLVWLQGDPPRHEVMVIYVEDLAAHDLTLAMLRDDPARWSAFRVGLLRRALATITVTPGR